MVAALTIKLTGFKDLERRLERLPAKIERACFRKSLRATGTKIARKMKAGTPRYLGSARRSVKVKVRVRRGGAYARIGYTGRPSMVMRMYEFGGRRGAQPARPFFADATAGYKELALTDFREQLKQAVEKAGG